jgi:L-rhamnose mutarotase
MKLTSGNIVEYKKRHDEIWPELVELLSNAGISDYSIFYDEETQILFGYLKLTDDHTSSDLPKHPIMQKWWDYMNDGIMAYDDNNIPIVHDLKEVFHMD